MPAIQEAHSCRLRRGQPPWPAHHRRQGRRLSDPDRSPQLHPKKDRQTGRSSPAGTGVPSITPTPIPAKENRISKHQIGAEVDFYVQGMEDRPRKRSPAFSCSTIKKPLSIKTIRNTLNSSAMTSRTIRHPALVNKEIFIKIYQKDEGRDADNRHPHAYITLQVRFDRETKGAGPLRMGQGQPRTIPEGDASSIFSF